MGCNFFLRMLSFIQMQKRHRHLLDIVSGYCKLVPAKSEDDFAYRYAL